MADLIVFAPDLTAPDRLLLKSLADDIAHKEESPPVVPDVPEKTPEAGPSDGATSSVDGGAAATGRSRFRHPKPENGSLGKHDTSDLPGADPDGQVLATLKAWNDPEKDAFEPTVFVSVDLASLKLHPLVDKYLLQPYIRWGSRVARKPTDVVMITHLILYFMTSVPSALYLFWNFSYLHGFLHFAMQGYYVGTYTLMMHQHIHMRGILAPEYWLFDRLFPYVTDPLMGHTWNTYFYHHVKHHHVEGNGPDDLSSTLRYQRDSPRDFLCYLGRFYFLIWLELPLYFLANRRMTMAFKAAFWELSSYATYYSLARMVSWRATLFVFILPLLVLRVGLMVGNWGQHAFVDPDEPDSDYRSSITLIDVPSNRYCFNDGYHTSHHLNPLRHWRDHPAAFLQQRHTYAREGALVFHNIDYLMITVRLLMRDYDHLARCMVPIGHEQIAMSLEERAAMLRRHARRFSEEEISLKFGKTSPN